MSQGGWLQSQLPQNWCQPIDCWGQGLGVSGASEAQLVGRADSQSLLLQVLVFLEMVFACDRHAQLPRHPKAGAGPLVVGARSWVSDYQDLGY